VIEMLSPSNEVQTRANIWADTIHSGVQEILAVHSNRIEAEVLRRCADGGWPAGPDIHTDRDMLTLRRIGFATTLATFYRTTALAS
jgi:Uma2 family endonuclease